MFVLCVEQGLGKLMPVGHIQLAALFIGARPCIFLLHGLWLLCTVMAVKELCWTVEDTKLQTVTLWPLQKRFADPSSGAGILNSGHMLESPGEYLTKY